ncbi:RES domain-containing protein [Purpureocillium lavendulum]|uniref:RES domain-containing protein n=1 Tax=Purpureocillium lavendulum TaxID=1247861 RepID=A0AB34G157_9HYPO|nr:RES domain-containing protein [Purpureocillium lavendulum]
MARPRVPSVYAVLQLFLRLASIALCISAFTAAVAATAKFDLGRAMSGAFVASILAIPIDVSEVIGLADAKRHARRCTEGALCGADFVTAVICGTVPVLVYLSVDGVYHECPGRPSEECDREERRRTDASQYVFAAWVLPLVVGWAVLHFPPSSHASPCGVVEMATPSSPRLSSMLKSPFAASSRWINKRRGKASDPPAMPVLPAQRARHLTPTPSCESLVPHVGLAIAASPFFQRLPAELRRQILIEAFGGQTVHMDLLYDSAVSERTSGGEIGHCGMPIWDMKDAQEPRVSEGAGKQWIWRSSVCHRNPPTSGPPGHRVQPSQDLCRFGAVGKGMCQLWPGGYPAKCFIGAMGWLLTCRQAYIEGIEVLYSTNTIHTASKEVLCHIDRFLLPQRRLAITSVELLWEMDCPPLRDSPCGTLTFGQFLDGVPVMFPRVESFHLTVQWRNPRPERWGMPNPTQAAFRTAEETIMQPVDGMVRRLGAHVRDCSVAIPSSMYGPRRRRAKVAGAIVEQACYGGCLERYWRPLDGASHRKGYWVRHGHKDIALPYMSPTEICMEDWILFYGV